MRQIFFMIGIGFLAGVCTAKTINDDNTTVPEYIQSTGGSNFCMCKVGDEYLVHQEPDSWYKPGVLNHAVGAFHLQSPGYMEETLSLMHKNGQRKIALVIWHMHLSEELSKGSKKAEYENIHGHVLNSKGGELCKQHKQNLVDLLRLIRKTGFENVTIRFASQGVSCPTSWKGWDEKYYQENLSFIISTKRIVDRVLKGKVPVLYDLGLELGGIETNLCSQYTSRLWKEYTARFGVDDTIGFSFAVAPGRLSRMLEIYKQSGFYPIAYPLDIYFNADKALKYVSEEFSKAQIENPAIIIQETFYNDAQTLKEVQAAAKEYKLKILYIMQWQVEREKLYTTDKNGKKKPRHFSVSCPVEYNNYLK